MEIVMTRIKRIIIFLSVISLLSSCGIHNTANQNETRHINKSVMSVYGGFLNGNREAKTENGNTMQISDVCSEFATSKFEAADQYAIFDMNGDDIPELHVRSGVEYHIFTYYNQELLLWHTYSSYSWPTDDHAILYTRYGGAPTHINYQYEVLDFWGNTSLLIEFAEGDINNDNIYDENDDYYFEGVEVTKSQWDVLTAKYLSSTSGSIVWKQMSDTIEL